jgi:hypothetical protein
MRVGQGGVGKRQPPAIAQGGELNAPGFEVVQQGRETGGVSPINAALSAQQAVVKESGDGRVLFLFLRVRQTNVAAWL